MRRIAFILSLALFPIASHTFAQTGFPAFGLTCPLAPRTESYDTKLV